jgi:hypothetical protein
LKGELTVSELKTSIAPIREEALDAISGGTGSPAPTRQPDPLKILAGSLAPQYGDRRLDRRG